LLENLTLTAVVTREGQLASVKVLRKGSPDPELDRAVSRLVSSLQFVPARVGDAPVAVSVVWLLERTTVRGET
jgi:TonB family protein